MPKNKNTDSVRMRKEFDQLIEDFRSEDKPMSYGRYTEYESQNLDLENELFEFIESQIEQERRDAKIEVLEEMRTEHEKWDLYSQSYVHLGIIKEKLSQLK